jgi:hypothetical protein
MYEWANAAPSKETSLIPTLDFPPFWPTSLILKNKSGLMRPPCCLCVCESPHTNFWMSDQIFMKLVYHVTWARLNGVLHKSLPSVCVSVCVSLLLLLGESWVKCMPPFIARQRHGKHVTAAKNTCNNTHIMNSHIPPVDVSDMSY